MKSLAFYSAQAAEMFGTSIYLDDEGKEVELTALISDANNYKWNDKVYLGEIDSINFVRRGIDGYFSWLEEVWDQAFDLGYDEQYAQDYEDDLNHQDDLDYEDEPDWEEKYLDEIYKEEV